MIPMSKEVLVAEVNLGISVLMKWKQKIEEGVPGRDFPGDEVSADAYCRELTAELLVVAGKMENLANIIAADGS